MPGSVLGCNHSNHFILGSRARFTILKKNKTLLAVKLGDYFSLQLIDHLTIHWRMNVNAYVIGDQIQSKCYPKLRPKIDPNLEALPG